MKKKKNPIKGAQNKCCNKNNKLKKIRDYILIRCIFKAIDKAKETTIWHKYAEQIGDIFDFL